MANRDDAKDPLVWGSEGTEALSIGRSKPSFPLFGVKVWGLLFFGQTYLKIPQMAHWRLQPISPGGIVSWYVLLGVSESSLF